MVDFAVGDVCLVGDEDEVGLGVCVALDFVDPVVFDVLKGVAVGGVEDEEDCVGV